jgi:NADPH:quinone reductase-like Zn-dependent oxidoreductase
VDAEALAPAGSMRAIVQDRYGSADAWRLTHIERPAPRADEVLVRVMAAGLDRGTWHVMTGLPYLMRVMGFGFRRPKQRVPGLDFAGTVVGVGASVTAFEPGDEVFGVSRGSFAEYAVARERKVAPKPAALSFEQAAVVPISGMTALQALRAGRLTAGAHVLIIGASGGVGSYAVQLAKIQGAEVTGVCSSAKVELVLSLGADNVIDYTVESLASGPRRYDVIIDVGGNTALATLRRTLTPRGTLVIVGGEQGGNVTGGFGRSLRAPLLSPFVRQRLTMLVSKETAEDLEPLTELLERGRLIPSIDTTFPLERAAEAMRRLEAGQVRGKLAITVSS